MDLGKVVLIQQLSGKADRLALVILALVGIIITGFGATILWRIISESSTYFIFSDLVVALGVLLVGLFFLFVSYLLLGRKKEELEIIYHEKGMEVTSSKGKIILSANEINSIDFCFELGVNAARGIIIVNTATNEHKISVDSFRFNGKITWLTFSLAKKIQKTNLPKLFTSWGLVNYENVIKRDFLGLYPHIRFFR